MGTFHVHRVNFRNLFKYCFFMCKLKKNVKKKPFCERANFSDSYHNLNNNSKNIL